MQVRLLGEIEAVDDLDRAPIAMGGPNQRRMLAALALRRNEVVSVSRIIDVVWSGGEPPHRAEHNVRTYIHRLRAALDGDADRIETLGAGYRLRLADDEIDTACFERLAGLAGRLGDSGDTVAALEAIEQAEQLWRGDPLQEFRGESWAASEAVRLLEQRVALRIRRAELLLAGGRASEAIALLEAIVHDEPLREQPRGLLMRALYEAGRQPEALRAFQEFRTILIEEIGVDPSAELVALDRAIAVGQVEPLSAPSSRTVGVYELNERIGVGAFAVVHRATQASLGREVAVKIVRAELANQPEFIRRFEAEAQLVARIEHPNVVPLYDFWREPDRAFLVMRWMGGGSLESRIDDGPWTVDATLDLVDQIAGALDAAHRAGVVHRDVKPANILFDEDGRAFLGDFGIALSAEECAHPEVALSEGSPVFAAPEQLRREPAGPEADVHSLAIVAFTLLAGRTPFADATDEPALLQCQLHDPIPPVHTLREGVPAAVDEVLAIAAAKRACDRYNRAPAFAQALRAAALNNVAPDVANTTDLAPAVRPRANPYKGLRAFDETDAADFHGRDRLVAELVAHLSQPESRMLGVVGPSGSGKSSVVRAGVIPALRHDGVPGSSSWFITTMIPGTRPFEALETALLRIAVNPPAALLDQLRDGDRGILRSVRRVVPDDGGVVAIVIDQFEELFTGDVDHDPFLRALAVAVTEARSPLRVLLTLRADFYDRPLRHPELAPLLKRHTVAVTPLVPDELERAITTPAAAVGVGFERGLVAEIVADVNHEPGALPLLQYALTEVFDAAAGDTITIEAYRSIGGLTGALARRAEELWQAADTGEQRAARRLFGRLITLGEGTEDTRRRARLIELGTDPSTRAAIARLGAARLLTFDHDPATREPTIELAHEALIREWPRLRGWLDDDRDTLRTHRHLTTAARSWAERECDPNELYRGARLDTAAPLLSGDVVALDATEIKFLDASLRRRTDDQRVERARVRRLHRLVATTAAVAVVALIAGAIALVQWRRADDHAAAAAENERDARANADDAAASAVRAEEARI
jgi:serine/threonine protein kinase